jgi:50S ribosomal protein L16 3-hydroxylase
MIAQSSMDISLATPLLGGLSPRAFMRKHWQKRPLLVRQAVPGGVRLIERARLFDMVAAEEVESRLVVNKAGRWSIRHGPMRRSALPPLKQREWTLLVQGLDLHLPAARALLDGFRFVPDARLDDLMISYASDGGGVGPHIDSYDVFLLQAEGRRRWRIGRPRVPELVPGVPLKLLANFDPEQSFLLEPGDMLYLPPGWAHDGVAEGACTTCSIGFRAPRADEIGRDVLQRVLDAVEIDGEAPLYRDAAQPATASPGQIPAALHSFATAAVARLQSDPHALACALGEVLSEPKRGVWFDTTGSDAAAESGGGLTLDARTRMIYDARYVFVNGESFRAAGRDARLMRKLADERRLSSAEWGKLSPGALELLNEWIDAGWLRCAESA